MVLFRWFGLSCFEIKDSVTIVTDPHDGESLGLNRPNIKGDIVTISHGHFDHVSGKELVSKEDTEVVDGTGKFEVKGIQFEGISNREGDERGRNIYFVFELDGFRICHLGDLGYSLESDNIEALEPVDILLLPVGGTGGHEGREAINVVKELSPSIVIPMHYMIRGLNVKISSEEEFLDLMAEEGWRIEEKKEAVIERLPEEKEIIKLICRTSD
ncbi:hypothetical protein AKJ39_00940 [candidate division MSBL1 archaeon SCGC-AAA259J03]|uniref:Metallo-beta-lactamase domain-containing protein n=1 Tax=candidate division MSBL1 archaeon SCGC-AAA259J03 TaxID=1698269 RepID=A0A656YXB4_9EURY|nr:hypothetical protein AKJ39_00940 [candidate division MSBL1 archaeon SCGC-AAA259J03]